MTMNLKPLALSVLVLLTATVSCKKEKTTTTDPTPQPAVEELLTPTDSKSFHLLLNGNTRDTSGNGYHGGESNALAWGADRFNRANHALLLNGTDAITEIRSDNMAFPFSFSLWVNTADAQRVATLFQTDRGQGAYYGCWLQQSIVNPGKLAFNIGNGTSTSSSGRKSLFSSINITPNQWHHIVINVRGAGDMELYVDGTKDSEAIYDGSAATIEYSGNAPVGLLGGGFSGQYFSGAVDDFRAYKRALTPNEIAVLKNFQP